MVPLLVGNWCYVGNEEGFAPAVDFSAFSTSRTIIISPEFMMTWQKSVCRAQEREPALFSPTDKAPRCPALWPTALEHLPYIPRWISCSTDTRLPWAESWPPNHCTKAWDGLAAVPCQPRACHNDPRDKRFDIPTPGSALCPVDVSITRTIHAPADQHKHTTQRQLEAQRAKSAAKDTHDSVWLLWKQLLWVARSGCRHCKAWQWWQITQNASSACAWYKEQNFCLFSHSFWLF